MDPLLLSAPPIALAVAACGGAGLAILLIGWPVARLAAARRAAVEEARADAVAAAAAARAEATAAAARHESQHEAYEALRARHSDQRELLARIEERLSRVPELEEAKRALEDRLDAARDQVQRLTTRIAALEAEDQARRDEISQARSAIDARFRDLAGETLRATRDDALKLMTERFETERKAADAALAQRQEGIAALLQPVRETLHKFETQVTDIEAKREGAYQSLRTQVEMLNRDQRQLNEETRRLVTALRAPKTRGQWGEFQLRQVFEMAGMVEHVDFDVEVSAERDGARLRPDALVRMPGGKNLIVDAKTPLDGYLEALEADSPDAQAAALKRHADQVRRHVKQLADKQYWDGLTDTPDFVVMFIPGETFYAAALEQAPDLFEVASAQRVVIATPTTLIALAKTVAYGWQQERLSTNAVEVLDGAKELYKRLGVFGGHLDKVGRGLSTATRAYNAAIGSYDTRVLKQARRLEELSLMPSGEALPDPSPLDEDARPIASPEAQSGITDGNSTD